MIRVSTRPKKIFKFVMTRFVTPKNVFFFKFFMVRIFFLGCVENLTIANFEKIIVARGNPNPRGRQITIIFYLVEMRSPLLL